MFTKDGYHKALTSKTGDDAYILLGNGGHKKLTELLESASLGASGNSTTLSITVAGTTKSNSVTVAYATKAGQWYTARTLTIGGTGKSVDGTSNVSWSLDEIGVYSKGTTDSTFVKKAGDTMTGPLTINSSVNNNYNEGIRITRAGNSWAGITFGSTGTAGAPTGGWFVATNPSNQFIINPDDSGNTAGLCLNKGGDLKWRNNIVIHAGNYTTYTVTKTGGGASGTWGINISGNAATATTWQTARTLTIGATGKSVNGSANVSWSLDEIGVYSKSTADGRYVYVSGDTMTGTLTMKAANKIYFPNDGDYTHFYSGGTSEHFSIGYGRIQGYSHIYINADTDGSTSEYILMTAGRGVSNTTAHGLKVGYNSLTWLDNVVWHAGNDGSGSGLDADLLDGIHANGLFTSFGNSGNNITATIGGTTKTFTVNYASNANALTSIIAEDKLPPRLRAYSQNTSSNRNVDTTNRENGFYWSNSGTQPANIGDIDIITVNANSSYGHQLGFKFSGNGTTGASYDGKDIYTRIFNNGSYLPWYVIYTAGNTGWVYDSNFRYEPHTKRIVCLTANSSWNKQIYTKQSYIGNCSFSFKPANKSGIYMIGLNADPTANADYSSIDYCFYLHSDGYVRIYESGSNPVSYSGYNAGDEFKIEYADGYIRYYHNGVIKRTATRSGSGAFYVDSSFYTTSEIYDVEFRSMPQAINHIYGTDNTAANAMLHSGPSRGDDAAGSTWIFVDDLDLGRWGIFHNQPNNNIEFYGNGIIQAYVGLYNGGVFSKYGFHHSDHNNNNAVLLAGGGWKLESNLSVSYAASAGSVTWDNVSGKPGAVGSASVPVYWTGSGFGTCIASFGNSSYGEHNANNITDNGIKYYTSNGPSGIGETTSDGALYSQAYNSSWVGQIAQDYRDGGLYVRGRNNGTWTTWNTVADRRNWKATYGTTDSTTYIKININSYTYWMLSFVVRVYQSYTHYDIVFQGYNYGSNHWYSPVATLRSSSTTSVTVYFGYDSDMHLWVAIPGASYTGVEIIECSNGYYQTNLMPGDLFTISNVSSLSNIQSTQTIYRPWMRNETVSNATYANSAGAVAWGNVSSKPDTATRWPTWAEVTSKPGSTGSGTQPVYWNGSTFVACTAYGSASVNYANSAGSAPASDVYAWAKASTKPSYSFSEITPGTADIGDGAYYMRFRTNGSWASGIYYHTTGNEALVFANVNSATSWIFANTNPSNRADWTTLSPGLQIKNKSVYINSLIGNGVTPSYNFYVNGTSYMNGNLTMGGGNLTIDKLDSNNSRSLLFNSGTDTGDIHLWGEGHMFSFAINSSSGSGVLGILPNHIYTNRYYKADGGFVHNSYNSSSYVLLGNGGASQLKTINGTSIFGSGNITISGGGGNADTVDSQHFSYSNSNDNPTYVWGTDSSGSNYLAVRENMFVGGSGYAKILGKWYDRRDTDNAPSFYYDNGFKGCGCVTSELAEAGSAHGWFETRITTVPWWDTSGGRPVQLALANSGAYLRTAANRNTWNSWETIITSANIGSYINVQSVHYGYDDGFWETIPYIGGDGVIEIGKYVDWHESNHDSRDYAYRMESKNGTIYCTGSLSATGFNNISDIRKKNILSYIDIDINNIAHAPIFNFTWNDNKINNYYNIRVGTSAQYWQTFLPWVVNITQDSIGTLSLQYDVAALVSAISIAKKTVEHEQKISYLESQIIQLRNEILNLKNTNSN